MTCESGCFLDCSRWSEAKWKPVGKWNECPQRSGEHWKDVAFTLHKNPMVNYHYLHFKEEREEQRISETPSSGGWSPELNPHKF